MIRSTTPPIFTVVRLKPELIAPAKSTPRELLPLSDIDDQEGLRFLVPFVQSYSGGCSGSKDPAGVIREALAEALVYYYPWAGRLREGSAKKLVVDCTGEGVLFVEASSDVSLVDLGGEGSRFLCPPFAFLEEVLFDVAGSSGIVNCPLLLVQVTKLRCGGFVLALRLNHTMTDAAGLLQFLNAVAELARGAPRPSVLPIWSRQLLSPRDPPRVTCTHREYDHINHNDNHNMMIEQSFFFGPVEVAALRLHLQPYLRRCSTFEVLAAFLWRCRTIALCLEPHENVRYLCAVNARPKLNPPLPDGYHGNVSAFPAAVSTAGELSSNDLNYSIELIKKAKAEVTDEYVRSVVDLMATRGRPHLTVSGTWSVSDMSRAGFSEIDFGWGKSAYGGPASAMVGTAPGQFGFFVKGGNGGDESGVVLLICLPPADMERFVVEVESVVGKSRSCSSTDVNCKL